MVALYRYIWVETDGKPRRILETSPTIEWTMPEFLAFQRELDGVAELAVVIGGKVALYV